MKEQMITMMAAMMPFMKPIAVAGVVGIVAGLVGGLRPGGTGIGSRLARLGLSVTLGVGVFFVACEIAGRYLGMEPTLLFASDPFDRALYRNQWPFWAIGAAFLVAGVLMRTLGRTRA